MKKLLFFAIFLYSYAQTTQELLQEAKMYEDAKDYKNAMLIYKKISLQNIENKPIKESNISEKNSNADVIKSFKEGIFKHNFTKTNDDETNSSLEQLITKDFGIYPYKKNYFLPATYSFNKINDQDRFETAFQISLEKPISHNFFGFNEIISLAYTQKSFWQTAASSAPFRETNYEPEVFAQIPLNNFDYLKLMKLSFLHSSNGKASSSSRSLNRAYLQTFFQFDNLFVAPRVWFRIPENSKNDNNKDFYKYYGYGDLNFLYTHKQHTFEHLLRNNLRFDSTNKGAFEFNWSFPLPEFLYSKNSFGLFQIFHGYGHSLIDYDKEVTNIGIGVAFSR